MPRPNTSALTVCRLMRKHRLTIRDVATRFQLPMTRVRFVRANGGPFDWPWMLTLLAQKKRKHRNGHPTPCK